MNICRFLKYRDVYAVGDCAHFKDPRSGQSAPPRAHIAVRQAKVVAHNILADIRGRDRKKYRYSNKCRSSLSGQFRCSDALLWPEAVWLFGKFSLADWLFLPSYWSTKSNQNHHGLAIILCVRSRCYLHQAKKVRDNVRLTCISTAYPDKVVNQH